MSKKEKAKKAKEFWARLAPLQAKGDGMTPAMLEWLREDDCYIPEKYAHGVPA